MRDRTWRRRWLLLIVAASCPPTHAHRAWCGRISKARFTRYELVSPLAAAVLFAFVLAGAVDVIVDMEFPRLGLIRFERFDQAIVDVRKGME